MIGTNVNLECYWKGSYSNGTWNVRTIDIKMEEEEISADIDTKKPATQEQQLNLEIQQKERSFFQRTKTCCSVMLPIDDVKSMTVSAGIFQMYENRNKMIQQRDGSFEHERRMRRDDLPIFMSEFPDFEPEATYQIKIVNEDDILLATITKKISDVAPSKFLESEPSSGIEADDQELATVETAVLLERLKEARRTFVERGEDYKKFETAWLTGNELQEDAASEAKGKAFDELSRLSEALEKRGFPQEDLTTLYFDYV